MRSLFDQVTQLDQNMRNTRSHLGTYAQGLSTRFDGEAESLRTRLSDQATTDSAKLLKDAQDAINKIIDAAIEAVSQLQIDGVCQCLNRQISSKKSKEKMAVTDSCEIKPG